MKKFLIGLISAFLFWTPAKAFQSEITFYRDPANALAGTTPGSSWKMPGRALSASSIRIYPGTKHVKKATWILVWAPNASGTYNSVRLVTADDGPTNLVSIAFIGKNSGSSPVVDSADITDAINEIIDSGMSKQIIMQTSGDYASSIYRSTIDLDWEE